LLGCKECADCSLFYKKQTKKDETMIPNLTLIIAVYCIVQLLAVATKNSKQNSIVNQWSLMEFAACGAIVVIAICTVVTFITAADFTKSQSVMVLPTVEIGDSCNATVNCPINSYCSSISSKCRTNTQ
jgi:hypothetical protein